MKFFRNFDFLLLSFILAISAYGLAVLWSIQPDLVGQQFLFLLLGFFLFFLFSKIDYHLFSHFRWPLLILVCLLLLATLFLAPQTRGATRWLQFGFWRFQPSEILKPFVILALAGFLTTSSTLGFKRLVFFLILAVAPLFLIFKQPDLGNTLIFILIFLFLLFMGGVKWYYMLGGLLSTVGTIPLLWRIFKDYQKERILSFLNPQSDPLGIGYNLIQAMVTVGSGQIFGRGLGRGTQSHLRFLPEQHTDFIFASLAEELGFIGAIFLIFLYFALLWRIIVIAQKSQDSYGILVATGILAMLLGQVFINIGMNIGLLPITGITLPLVSYGGSSIISIMVSLGITESVARGRKREEALEIK